MSGATAVAWYSTCCTFPAASIAAATTTYVNEPAGLVGSDATLVFALNAVMLPEPRRPGYKAVAAVVYMAAVVGRVAGSSGLGSSVHVIVPGSLMSDEKVRPHVNADLKMQVKVPLGLKFKYASNLFNLPQLSE